MNDNTLPEGWNYQFNDNKSSAGWKMEAGGLRRVEHHYCVITLMDSVVMKQNLQQI